MSDVRQKAKDLLRLAINSGTNQHERDAATKQLLALLERYDLLSAGGKPVDVAADALKELLKQALSGDIMDTIASHVEKYASGFERVMAAGKRITDARGPVMTKKKKRTYR
jgi:ribosomal protein L17